MPSQNEWRFVEVGRVCLVKNGKYANKLAVILDVVDQGRVLADSPAHKNSGRWGGIPRHVMSLKDLEPTPVTVAVQRGARVGTLTKALETQDTFSAWSATAWAKKIESRDARTNMVDFDRVSLDRARRQRSFALRKSYAAKLSAAGKKSTAAKVFTA